MNQDILAHRTETLEQKVTQIEQWREAVTAIHQEIIKFQQTLLKWLIGGIVMVVLSLFGSAMTAAYYLGQRNETLIAILRKEMKAEIGRLDARIDTLNSRFDDVNRRFDDLNRRFEDLKQVVLSRTQR